MRINLLKGYILRCLFAINVIIIAVPIFAIVLFFIGEILVGFFLLTTYLFIIFLTLVIAIILGVKKFNYKYVYFENNSYYLITKNEISIVIDNFIYLDNPILGILISPYYLIFNYEIKWDFTIGVDDIEYSKVYLSIIDFLKLKK